MRMPILSYFLVVETFFGRAGSGQHSIGIEAAVGIAKDWRSTAVQGRAR